MLIYGTRCIFWQMRSGASILWSTWSKKWEPKMDRGTFLLEGLIAWVGQYLWMTRRFSNRRVNTRWWWSGLKWRACHGGCVPEWQADSSMHMDFGTISVRFTSVGTAITWSCSSDALTIQYVRDIWYSEFVCRKSMNNSELCVQGVHVQIQKEISFQHMWYDRAKNHKIV